MFPNRKVTQISTVVRIAYIEPLPHFSSSATLVMYEYQIKAFGSVTLFGIAWFKYSFSIIYDTIRFNIFYWKTLSKSKFCVMIRNGFNGKVTDTQRNNEFHFDTRLLTNLFLSEAYLKTYFQNTRLMDLTPEQRLLIVQGWKKDNFAWLYSMGMQIYERIFQTAPSAKALFPYVVESEKAGQDFRESRKFRAQALRFVQIMAQVVSYVEDPVAAQKGEFDVIQCLFDVGKRHQRYALDRPFSPDLWAVYETAMQIVMEEEYG
uniref:Globin family profile domain-containing protein n=1 Tax=Romanomermis culicivorax TaxID=13658 RepID=A0A915JQM7_ROMCU